MIRTATRALTAAVVMVVAASSSHAYPISPQTLWGLVQDAEYVVVADVANVQELPEIDDPDEYQWYSSLASLRVRESLKGDPGRWIEVHFAANLICPAPPRYPEHERVLAFLAHDDEGRLHTVGLSYGTLYPSEEGFDDFRELIGTAIELQSRRFLRKRQRVDWLVEAASRPATRWHGLYELHPSGDSIRSYYDQARERRHGNARLSDEQLDRIAAGVVASPPVDHTLPMALGVLAGYPDPDLDRAALAAVEAMLAREHVPYQIWDALAAVLLRFGDPDPAARLAPLGDTWWRLEPDVVRRLWAEAREELDLPTVEPAPDPEVRVRGVGENTPD